MGNDSECDDRWFIGGSQRYKQVRIILMFSQASGFSTVRLRCSYIRTQRRPLSQAHSRSVTPSVVHLSSIIQSAKKNETQAQLISSPQIYPSFQDHQNRPIEGLSSEPKKANPTLFLYKLERQANEKLKKRKVSQDQIFLSEIADQATPMSAGKDSFKRQQEKDLMRTRRRNYIMRKLQFKNFLKAQELSRTTPLIPPEEPKEVQYQNQKIKSQSLKLPITKHSSKTFTLKQQPENPLFPYFREVPAQSGSKKGQIQ